MSDSHSSSPGGSEQSDCNSLESDAVEGKRPIRRTIRRITSPKSLEDSTESHKWSIDEKVKLLEGLKRYNDDVKSIASYIETKSSNEVAQMISEIEEKQYTRTTKMMDKRLDEDAPIDKWYSLLQKMCFYERKDYSNFISGAIGLISRNEEFAPSGHSRLDWKKLYQYLAALLDDNAILLPELSDIESTVILDLMDNVGSSLRHLDTSQQRQILDFKYKLLTKAKDPNDTVPESRAMFFRRNAKALSNEFWKTEMEKEAGPTRDASTAVASSSRTQSATPSAQQDNIAPVPEPSTSSTCDSDSISKKADPCSQSSCISNSTSQSSKLTRPSNPSRKRSKSDSTSNDEQVDRVKPFERPKFFTLNPLCIPASLMALKKKKKLQ